jgi:hypothetical protein
MNDRVKILLALALFLALASFPIWYTLGASGATGRPELQLPTDASRCIFATDEMARNHMHLLDDWRNAVVRRGEKEFTSEFTGKTYTMSLTGTCLGCHTDRDAFCTRCHDYAGVSPSCWDCHLEPKGNGPDG